MKELLTKTTYTILGSVVAGALIGVGGYKVYTQVAHTTDNDYAQEREYGQGHGRFAEHDEQGEMQGQKWGEEHGKNGQDKDDCIARLDDITKSDLSSQEKADILHMREEEKLARDVYLTLYDKWHSQVFKNIANSEQHHMDAVKALIDRYNLEDPVKSDKIGEFTDPKLKDLYNQLVAQGSKSLADALKVGATIEDLDIYDLDKAIKATDNEDVKLVYESLRSGSYNHMRAFVGQLKSNGSDYTPQYISKEEYDKILTSQNSHGRGSMGMRSQRQGNRGQGFRYNTKI